MAIMVSEVLCTNQNCKKIINVYQEGMQYANQTYEVTCPHCGETVYFTGQGCLKFHGEIQNFVETKVV